jgi:hypothetical protein
MLVATESVADFSSWCAPLTIANTIHLTRPLTIREVALANATHGKDERGR